MKMVDNGTVWVVIQKEGGITFVILTEHLIQEWCIDATDNGTRDDYTVEEVICYN